MAKKNNKAIDLLQAQRERAAELFAAGQFQAAEQACRQMLAKNRDDAFAIYHLSLILYQQGNHQEGLRLTERGVKVFGRFAPMWGSLAMFQRALGMSKEALQSFDQAIALDPAFEQALLNSGALLAEMLQHGAAVQRFQQILQRNPDHQKALGNCAGLLVDLGFPEQGAMMMERLVRLNPAYPYALGMLAHERQRFAQWRDQAVLQQAIFNGVAQGALVCKSLALMGLPSNAQQQYQCARSIAQSKHPQLPEPLWRGERFAHDKLRIAFVSADYGEHPVSHLLAGVVEGLDRSRFDVMAVSVGVKDESVMRRRLERAFDQFHDLAGQSAQLIAQRVREWEVDILIDLGGYTSNSRTDVFAHRPAPIQVGYLGFPGTLGSEFMDYIIADRQVLPPEHQPFFAEKAAYLPHTYLPTDASLMDCARPVSRAEAGLPETGAVLCAFGQNFKINAHLFEVWMRLLRQLPGSVLWMSASGQVARDQLRAEAQARGVAPERLVFTERVPSVQDHLSRYTLADVFLDTWPYNAHTTAADALMMGLPVVTYRGDAFASRVAASLLHAVGLPELVTDSLAAYEQCVLNLLQTPQRLDELKQRLVELRRSRPLFDTARYCRDLEQLFLSLQATDQPLQARGYRSA